MPDDLLQTYAISKDAGDALPTLMQNPALTQAPSTDTPLDILTTITTKAAADPSLLSVKSPQETEYCKGVNFAAPTAPLWAQGGGWNLIKETPDSGQVTFAKGNTVGRRTFRVPWVFPQVMINGVRPTYLDFVQTIMGGTGFGAGGAGTPPTVIRPDVFDIELNWLYAMEVTVKGENIMGYQGKDPTQTLGNVHDFRVPDYPLPPQLPTPAPLSPRAVFEFALVTVTYAPLDYNESFNVSAEAIQVPQNFAAFTNTDDETDDPSPDPKDQINTPLTLLFPKGEHCVERRQLVQNSANQDMLGLAQLPGRVNGLEITISGIKYPPYTILLNTIETRRTYYPVGRFRVWDATIRWAFDPGGWVKPYRWNPAGGSVDTSALQPAYPGSQAPARQFAKMLNNNEREQDNGVPGGGTFAYRLDTDPRLLVNSARGSSINNLLSAFDWLMTYS